jgi:hypothetical protein
MQPTLQSAAATVGNTRMAHRLVAVSPRVFPTVECLSTFPTVARKLKACHLMRRWGLRAAPVRATPPSLSGSGGHVSAISRAHRTHPVGSRPKKLLALRIAIYERVIWLHRSHSSIVYQ